MGAGVVVVIGPPAAGKGTQAERLAQARGGIHLSSGDLLRAAADPLVLAEMAEGELVDTPVVERAVEPALRAADPTRLLVLDGFIRLEEDYEWLTGLLESLGRKLTTVVYIQLDQAESVRRGLLRGRSDDTTGALAERWASFHAQTEPVIEAIRKAGLLTVVDGHGTVDEVASRVEVALAHLD